MTRLAAWTIFAVALGFVALVQGVSAQVTAINYQGKLDDSGAPASGSYQMQFKLFDSLDGAGLIGSIADVPVTATQGVFSVQLDFGSNAWDGANRWIEISVRHNAGESYSTLSPREQIAASPYSIRTQSAASADNALSLGGIAASQYLQTNGNGSGLTNLNGANITNNTINASALARELTVATTTNFSLLGSLRWDLLTPKSFAVGTFPVEVAFDGANIWVANEFSNNVTKLRASDGAVQGTFAVGTNPIGVAFDGANVWVTNFNNNNVTKLRASDGALQGTFAVGSNPYGIAFDGANIWVANQSSSNVTKLRASDGVLQGTFAVGTGPSGVAFDGANIWVTNTSSHNVTKLRASDGVLQATFAVSYLPQGIAFDGANMWVVIRTNPTSVIKLRASDGASQGTFYLESYGPYGVGVAFDGANIWVASGNSNVTKLRASDGVILGTFAAGTAPDTLGVAFDGANIWVTNVGNNNVTKLPVFR